MPKTILFAANKGLQATLGVTLHRINVGKVPKSPDSTLVTQSIMHNYSQALPFLREGGYKKDEFTIVLVYFNCRLNIDRWCRKQCRQLKILA